MMTKKEENARRRAEQRGDHENEEREKNNERGNEGRTKRARIRKRGSETRSEVRSEEKEITRNIAHGIPDHTSTAPHDTREGKRHTYTPIWPDAHNGSAGFRKLTNFEFNAAAPTAVEFQRDFSIYIRDHVQTWIVLKTCGTDEETNELRTHVVLSSTLQWWAVSYNAFYVSATTI